MLKASDHAIHGHLACSAHEKAPSITPEAFSFLEVVLPLSLHISPTVILFILGPSAI
jgi:hypothetical protein